MLSLETAVPFKRVRVQALVSPTYTALGIDAIDMTTMSRCAATLPESSSLHRSHRITATSTHRRGKPSQLRRKRARRWTLEPPRRLPVRREPARPRCGGMMSLMNPHAASEPSLAVCWLAQHHRLRPATNHHTRRRTPKNPAIPQSHSPLDPSVHVLRLAASVGEATHPNHRPVETPGGAVETRSRSRGTARAG